MVKVSVATTARLMNKGQQFVRIALQIIQFAAHGRVVGDDRGCVVFVGGVDYGGGGVACVAVAAVVACAAVAAVVACAAVATVVAVASCSAIGVALACIS